MSAPFETSCLGGCLFKESEFHTPNNVLCKLCIFHLLEWAFMTQIGMCCKPTPCPGYQGRDSDTSLLWHWPQSPAEGRPRPNCAALRPSVTFSCSFPVFRASSHTVFALCLATVLWVAAIISISWKMRPKEATGFA